MEIIQKLRKNVKSVVLTRRQKLFKKLYFRIFRQLDIDDLDFFDAKILFSAASYFNPTSEFHLAAFLE